MNNEKNQLSTLLFFFIAAIFFLSINLLFVFDKDSEEKSETKESHIIELMNLIEKYPEFSNYVTLNTNGIYEQLVINKNITLNFDKPININDRNNLFIKDLSNIISKYEMSKKNNIEAEILEVEIINQMLNNNESELSTKPKFVTFTTNDRLNELIISFNTFSSDSYFDWILLMFGFLFFIFSILVVISFFSSIKLFFMHKYKFIYTSYSSIIFIFIIYIAASILNLIFSIISIFKFNIYTIFFSYCFEISHIYLNILVLYGLGIFFIDLTFNNHVKLNNESKSFISKSKALFVKLKKIWLIDFFILSIKNGTTLDFKKNKSNNYSNIKIYDNSVLYNIENKSYLFIDINEDISFISIYDLIYLKKIRLVSTNFKSSIFLSAFISICISILFQNDYLDKFFYDFIGSKGFAFSLTSIIIFSGFFLFSWLSSFTMIVYSSRDSVIYDIILDDLISNASSNETTKYYYNKLFLFDNFVKTIDKKITISQCTANYIQNNPNLFPSYFYKSIVPLVHDNISFKDILDSPKKFDAQFIKIEVKVLNIELINNENLHCSVIRCSDYNNNLYDVCFVAELHDISKYDKLILVGMYLGISELKNEDNKIENVVLLAGSHIN